MKNFFRTIIEPSNAITIIGCVVAGILGYLGIKNQDSQTTLNAILAILMSLAVAQILNAYESSKVGKNVEKLLQKTSSFLAMRKELEERESFQHFLSQGHDILLTGISLVGTIGPLRTFLRTLANQGVRLRFLVFNPDSPCLEIAAKAHGLPAGSLRNDIMSSLMHLRQLKDSVSKDKAGNIDFRLLNTIPDASIVMRDGDRSEGIISCELYLYQVDTTQRPSFRLHTSDGEFYCGYRDALSRLWNDAEIPKFQGDASLLAHESNTS